MPTPIPVPLCWWRRTGALPETRPTWLLLRHVFRLIAEGARVPRSSPISSVVSVFMGMAVLLLVLATARQAAAIESKVLAGLDSPGDP